MDALIFDFDGVIADSEPAHEKAIGEVAQSSGMTVSHQFYLDHIIGLDDRDTFRVIAADHKNDIDEQEIDRLCGLKQARFLELVDEGYAKAFPGSVELIRASAKRLPIAVCSGAVRIEIDRVLAEFGIADLFRFVVSADDVERTKPDPAGYLLSAKKLGLDPSRCLAIEDTAKGIAAGKAAGLTVVGVCHSLPAELLSEADLVVDSIEELNIDRLMEL
ncbi:MAG: HAD family hydrolase [Phycisphaera sp.]|nr:MAG: HAD family hydrolase [Phycisphaera sp.]